MSLSDDNLLLATTADSTDPVREIVNTDLDDLSAMCATFKASLHVSDAQQCAIELETRGQASNPKWLGSRRNRVTNCLYVCRCREEGSP